MSIFHRIDAALEKMRAQGVGVRFIYLTEKTWDEFNRAMCRRFRRKAGTAHCFSYQDHQIRSGTKDVIYSEHGVGFTSPKKLSPRVRAVERKAA